MTHPEEFDVDRDGQWDESREGGPAMPDDAPAPAATGAGDRTDKVATVLMSVLIVLAVVASVVMLFTNSTGWMKIAVLAGLWAAVIGALLVTRYRRQLATERERIADLEVMHSLELDRELATHREQELILEQNYLDSLDANTEDTIAQLRAEIVALREHLAELLGADLDEERIALRARAERLREIDAPAPPLKDPESHQRPKPRASAHRDEATASGQVGSHTTHGAPQGRGARPAPQTEEFGEPAVQGVPEEWDGRGSFGVDDHDDREPVDVPEVDNGGSSDTGSPDTGSPDTGFAGHGRTFGGGFDTGSFKAVPWESGPEPEPEPHWGTGRHEQSGQAGESGQFGAFGRFGGNDAAWGFAGPEPHRDPEVHPDVHRDPEVDQAPDAHPDGAETRPTTVLPRVDGGDSDAEHDRTAEHDHTRGWGRTPEPEPAPEPPAADAGDAGDSDDAADRPGDHRAVNRGRRRAEDNADGLTVAELLAKMRENGN